MLKLKYLKIELLDHFQVTSVEIRPTPKKARKIYSTSGRNILYIRYNGGYVTEESTIFRFHTGAPSPNNGFHATVKIGKYSVTELA